MPATYTLDETTQATTDAGIALPANVPVALTPRLIFNPPRIGFMWSVDNVSVERQHVIGGNPPTLTFNVYVGTKLVVADIAMPRADQDSSGTIEYYRGAVTLPASIVIHPGQQMEIQLYMTVGVNSTTSARNMLAVARGYYGNG